MTINHSIYRALGLYAAYVLISLPVMAQGDLPKKKPSLLPIRKQEAKLRTANYHPDGRAIVCVNGNNRYTRALYGGPTEYRIETSDRPIFAIYKKAASRNLRFRLVTEDGQSVQIDSAQYCEARYEAGRRDYLLKDARWGKGILRISVLAYPDSEGGIWKFSAEDFSGKIEIEAVMCETSTRKLVRAGDIGSFANPQAFEPAAYPTDFLRVKARMNRGKPLYFSVDDMVLSVASKGILVQRYENAEKWRADLAGSVVFDTPDPYLNPLGGAMVMAADGAWNGQVWQHGAVGWRMSLPGWRGAYMGDFLGMQDRQRIHFDAYAKSQVTDVPVTKPHLMDEKNNLARGTYAWGTPMYSNGYICRNPENNHQFHHYDMNLVFIDELLWHFQFDADTAYMRKMWPVIQRHLAWEKQAWDPDNDGLYDAYCCIWASDALQYNSGAVTHSSAYNYRANHLAARIATLIGEDPQPYEAEARKIQDAIQHRLWLEDKGHWAEYQDFMGLKRVHENAALWSVYTPIDSEVGTPQQWYRATQYVDKHIPHLPFQVNGKEYQTISTSNWAPYEWSLNNVAMAEVMHTILAYYQAGRTDEAYRLLQANVLDFMYLGSSPGNFGQLSMMDKATGEGYRDFADVTGISSRALIEGLYGITPQALDGVCIIRPGFPSEWRQASIHTPYLDYSFKREGGKDVFDITQRFPKALMIVIRQNLGDGRYKDTPFSADEVQHISLPSIWVEEKVLHDTIPQEGDVTLGKAQGTAFDDVQGEKCQLLDITKSLNAKVTDIFENQYLSPRSPYTTLCVPTQGIGDWCSTKRTAHIDDAKLRSLASRGIFQAAGIPFRLAAEGKNVAYTSLWDNYPDSLSIPLQGKASHAYLMLVGSTNAMQFDIANGVIVVEYADGTEDRLELRTPNNWCPIEQDYLEDAVAFPVPEPRPYRVGLASGMVSRHLFRDLHVEAHQTMGDLPGQKKAVAEIDGGAAVMLDMPLDGKKKLKCLRLRTLSNEVVIGVMGITLQRE